MSKPKTQFWIDRGGTFTDVIARLPDGALKTEKLLSENPGQYEDAALEGISRIMNGVSGSVGAVKMGTTVATNALLERQGERVLLVTTKGFRDALAIAYQNRPKLFDLDIIKPELLHESTIEVIERMSASGETLEPLDLKSAEEHMHIAFDQGIRATAILLMHGYKYPAHEKALAKLAAKIGFTQISTSHEVSPLMKFVSRGDTTAVDAYLTPILRRYIETVEKGLKDRNDDAQLQFMRSDGGLTSAKLFQGKDAILSGPAGGVVGMTKISQMAGFERVIGFDMGGTSTDVSHFAGELERSFETKVAGVRMRAPMMAIHTVAAGGGSILAFDGMRFRVGPESAGANPGPASYGNGGPLTITDANLMLGKIHPGHFPRVFGPDGRSPLDKHVVEKKFVDLAEEIGDGRSPHEVAEGFLTIAILNMSSAIKKISIARGYDVSDYVLTSFGGAGAQHACLVADALGMESILLHPLAGVLSAYGMGLAEMRATRQQGIEKPLSEHSLADTTTEIRRLRQETTDELTSQGIDEATIVHRTRLHLKTQGSDTSLPIAFMSLEEMASAFERDHKIQFGFIETDIPLVIEAIDIESIAPGTTVEEADFEPSDAEPRAHGKTEFFTRGELHAAPIYLRDTLLPGQRVKGPALICEEISTIVIEPGWQGEVTGKDHLLLTRSQPRETRVAIGTHVDPVQLEIFNNLFMSIAEQMGVALEKTASSVNIKERLDFSCAVFDPLGHLIANAPHMPVHLGSMGDSVRSIRDQYEGAMAPGDAYVLNNPYNGGTHLPDITIVAPVFDQETNDLTFFVAARGHHADVGGLLPGSMPAHSKTLEEEGVLIDNVKLVSAGTFQEGEIRDLLTHHRYPARNPAQNIADLKAQVAACMKGIIELEKMVAHYGREVAEAYMGHVQDNAEENVRRVIDVLEDNAVTHEMDDGSQIHITIRVDKTNRSATIDFTGTSPMQQNNFNAPASIARAAVLYVFRCLVDDDIPLNAGCLKPINLVLPETSLINPAYPAAVVAGNVETSQAVTDALFEACKALAGSQGTMNNLTFGNETFQYYETICGGAAAGPGFDGASAVQTHMTNSRLTDPEVLEHRFPVILESFSIHERSGGTGKHKGGDGTVRKIKFLEDMDLSILSSGRRIAPKGLYGGGNGARGENLVLRRNGTEERLKGADITKVHPGDTIIVKTPGGGGFGKP